jgi:glycosyltransferase involved in cell wall biosynthesis
MDRGHQPVVGPRERRSVMFAIPSLDRGGPDRVLYELLCEIDRTKFAPRLLVSSPHGDYLSRLPSDIPVDVLGEERSFRDRYPLVRTLRRVRALRPDVVFGTQRMILTLGTIAGALPRTTRLVLRQANDLTADSAALMKTSLVKHRIARQASIASLRRADAVVCQSHAMRADLSELLGPQTALHVIYNPIDVEAIAATAREHGGKPPGAPALVSVGRLAAQKGFDILLPAIAQVRARHPGLHLTIYGDGPDRAKLEAQIRELHLADAVTLAGFSTTLLGAVAAADAFVLASRYEGFPNAALEALACGTPVVLTNCPGANAEIVREGENGRLARSVDSSAFAAALEMALAERDRYARSAIRADCAARFSKSTIVRAYEDVFTPHDGKLAR